VLQHERLITTLLKRNREHDYPAFYAEFTNPEGANKMCKGTVARAARIISSHYHEGQWLLSHEPVPKSIQIMEGCIVYREAAGAGTGVAAPAA
jgi:hypothetical protein